MLEVTSGHQEAGLCWVLGAGCCAMLCAVCVGLACAAPPPGVRSRDAARARAPWARARDREGLVSFASRESRACVLCALRFRGAFATGRFRGARVRCVCGLCVRGRVATRKLRIYADGISQLAGVETYGLRHSTCTAVGARRDTDSREGSEGVGG
eukprot:210403-Prymnesium_polylepis.2